MMKTSGRPVRIATAIALLWGCLVPLGSALQPAYAASGGATIDVSDTSVTSGTGWTFSGGVFTITGSDEVTVIGETTVNRLVIASGSTATVTLDGARIETSLAPIEVAGATLTLRLMGTNTLTGGSRPAIHVPVGASLTITSAAGEGATDGTLNATAQGSYDAAIGGGNGISGSYQVADSAGAIMIEGGTINAVSGQFGAAIGGGDQGSGGTILISGGDVYARSQFSTGAAIGCAAATQSGVPPTAVTITGGSVVAENPAGAAIGRYGGTNTSIEIAGGTVEVRGGSGIDAAGTEIGGSGTLVIAPGVNQAIREGQTVTNNGNLINNGTVTNNGTLTNNGVVEGDVANNGTIDGDNAADVAEVPEPPAPANFQAENKPASDAVLLSWDAVENAANYQISASEYNGGAWFNVGDVTSYTLGSWQLAFVQENTLKVRAVVAGKYGVAASATTTPHRRPEWPRNLSVVANDASGVTLTWEPGSDGGSAITHYEYSVNMPIAAGFRTAPGTNATTTSLTIPIDDLVVGMSNNRIYLHAVNEYGSGDDGYVIVDVADNGAALVVTNVAREGNLLFVAFNREVADAQHQNNRGVVTIDGGAAVDWAYYRYTNVVAYQLSGLVAGQTYQVTVSDWESILDRPQEGQTDFDLTVDWKVTPSQVDFSATYGYVTLATANVVFANEFLPDYYTTTLVGTDAAVFEITSGALTDEYVDLHAVRTIKIRPVAGLAYRAEPYTASLRFMGPNGSVLDVPLSFTVASDAPDVGTGGSLTEPWMALLGLLTVVTGAGVLARVRRSDS
ncbi:MAG: fibronectin type III domain-containing protein [Propionibacteriaceae bacterium]|jgi:hypothetical protein|nr:fibronectin type III domain-containing protein [Propionibacteriaceae bacterium]